jgi:DNA-directed RNA polymerase subunit RPC12/RpoP
MVDKPRRPILHLKFPAATPPDADASKPDAAGAEPATPAPPPPAAPAPRTTPIAPGARTTRTVREFTPVRTPRPPRPPRPVEPEPPKPKPFAWKCKPCGKGLDVGSELADEDSVRCPYCNARLGLAKDFRSDPPNLDKVRARMTGKG